ncbi:MAG: GNAT family N-acetyltransferase [Tahibacter sp.]
MPTPATPPFQIRPARDAELDALASLENRVFDYDRLSRRQYRRHLHSSTARVLVARHDGGLMGSAVLFFRRGSRVGRLYSLAVAETARGLGLGRRLLAASEAEARRRSCDRLRLEVRADNTAAARLYESAGYSRCMHLPRYYDNGADGWRYEKQLCA